jgi:hypothetical protein
MPSLRKVDEPRSGDSGSMSLQVWMEDGKVQTAPGKPIVGRAIRVGTPFGRSYSNQDWWQTSLVKEIIEETEEYVKFLTESGSTYEWWA